MKITLNILMVLSFMLMTALPVRAEIPAPPANQLIGINDGVFNDLDEADCRLCHENPDQYPVEDETLPNRHHLLYGTAIPTNTDVPIPDADGDGTADTVYGCLNCHQQDTSGGIIQFIVERDCTQCHIQGSSFELTVHHRTDLALGNLPQGPDCKACHGSLVDNMEDGHFIPDYDPSLVTPRPSGGAGLPLNSELNGAGACDYCHSTGTGDSTPGTDTSTGTDILVYTSEDTHHETGFWGGMGAHGFVCFWCHDNSLPEEERIRVCENCHGPDSLHNIQVDSDGDGIINPGVELPGYGHIGDPDECWGCHGFSFSAEPNIGPIIPYINSISKSSIITGSDTVIILTGSGFRNIADGTDYSANVVLTTSDGSTFELLPNEITVDAISVTIPGTLETGNYILRAVKADKLSNPENLSVTPEVVITDLDCSKCLGTMTITGSGFSEKPDGSDEDISVNENGRPLNIISWTDNEIRASGSRCSGTVEVDAVFGSVSQSQE
jgi:hypothetical protein